MFKYSGRWMNKSYSLPKKTYDDKPFKIRTFIYFY